MIQGGEIKGGGGKVYYIGRNEEYVIHTKKKYIIHNKKEDMLSIMRIKEQNKRLWTQILSKQK